MAQPARAAALVAIAIAGQLLVAGLSIALARHLAVEQFEAYVVASAAFVVLATLAPRGGEKHLLRTLPALLAAGRREQAATLVRFGARRTLLAALAAALAVAGAVVLARSPADATRAALLVACLSLPAGALVHFGVEALTAAGRPRAALALARLLVPGLALALSLALLGAGATHGAAPVAAWGLAWLAALLAFAALLHRAGLLPLRARPPPTADRLAWRAEARPFLAYRVALAVLAQAAILALDLLQPSPTAVGAYAAALAVAGLAATLATATNRAYARELALHLDRRDFAGLHALRRQRLRWLVPALLAFLAATLLYPAELLALFRPEFAREGTTALRLLVLATALTVLFALAPTYLKYRRRGRTTVRILAVAAVAQLALLAALIPHFGATGAAIAYAVSMTGMYGAFAVAGHRELARLRAANA